MRVCESGNVREGVALGEDVTERERVTVTDVEPQLLPLRERVFVTVTVPDAQLLTRGVHVELAVPLTEPLKVSAATVAVGDCVGELEGEAV